MFSAHFSGKRLLAAVTLSGWLLTGLTAIARADSNPGLTIFSGVERENILSYFLDFGGHPDSWDRYRLRIPAKKMKEGASKFIVDYPDYYDGKFNPQKIEVRIKGDSLPLREVYWDKENHLIEIDLEEDITKSQKVEIVMSGVKNPDIGTYYFNCQAVAAGPYPIRLYLGTWILDITRPD